MALDPDFPTDGSIYVLYTHDAAIGGTAPRYNDACADPTGNSTGAWSAVALSRALGSDGSEEVLDRGLVPAVPKPLGRQPRVRALRCSVCERWRRGQLRLRRLRPGEYSPKPVWGSARRCRRHAQPTLGRGWRAAEPGPSVSRPIRRRSTAPILRLDPATGAGMAGNPSGRQQRLRMRDGSSPTGCGTRSGSRSVLAPTNCGSGTSDGTRCEEVNRSDCPGGRLSRQLRLALLRGQGRQPGYDSIDVAVCESLYASAERSRAASTSPTTTTCR